MYASIIVTITLITLPLLVLMLTVDNILITYDSGSQITLANKHLLKELKFSIVGVYEKDGSDVVVKSYDVGTYTFLQYVPYNVTKKDVVLSEIIYYTDLSKETRLVLEAGVVRNHGYHPLTSDVNVDEMFKVKPRDILLHLMLRNWCGGKGGVKCTTSNILEYRINIKTKARLKEFRPLPMVNPTTEKTTSFCSTDKSSCAPKFQEFQINSCKLSFSNYVNINGAHKLNPYPVQYENKSDTEIMFTMQTELSDTEMLFGPIWLTWQAFEVSRSYTITGLLAPFLAAAMVT